MVEVRTYTLEHFYQMQEMGLRAEDNKRVEDPNYWEIMTKFSEAYSVFVDGEILFSGGVLMLRKGFGEAWLLCSILAYRYPITVYRMAKGILEQIIEDGNLYRVRATPRTNWPTGYRFVERLGFQREGVLRKYGLHKEDCFMYGRIT